MSNMRPIVMNQPSRIEIGAGVLGAVGQFVGTASVLVVTSPSVAKHVAAFGLQGAVTIYDRVPAEPNEIALQALLDVAAAVKPDVVVGLGGGSVMDLAKLAAVLWDGKQTLQEVVGPNKVDNKLSRIVQVPTTAGTGSEAGTKSLVADSVSGGKMAVDSPKMLADLVVLDPQLTFSVPTAVTAATGVDALAHCVEAFTSAISHPLIDEYARIGIKLIGCYLKRAVADGSDVEAREGMMLASFYGGVCLGPVNTAAGHAVAYPLSTTLHLPHGLANALVFPHVLAFNYDAVPEKSAEIAAALGFENCTSSAQLYDAAYSYCTDLGIDMSLQHQGAQREQLQHMAESAHGIRRLMDNNPRDMSIADILGIYNQAY